MELTAESAEDLIEQKAQAYRNAVTKIKVERYLIWREHLPADITARILAIMKRYDSKSGVDEKSIMEFFTPTQQPTARSMLARMRMERHMSYRQRKSGNGIIRFWRMRGSFIK